MSNSTTIIALVVVDAIVVVAPPIQTILECVKKGEWVGTFVGLGGEDGEGGGDRRISCRCL